MLLDTEQLPEAEEVSREGLAVFKQLAAEVTARPDFRYHMIVGYHNVACVLDRTNRRKEAEKAFREAVKAGKELVRDHSDRTYRHQLVLSSGELAYILSESGRPTEAEANWREILELSRQLTSAGGMAIIHYNLGNALEKLPGRLDEAITEYREAIHLNDASPTPTTNSATP